MTNIPVTVHLDLSEFQKDTLRQALPVLAELLKPKVNEMTNQTVQEATRLIADYVDQEGSAAASEEAREICQRISSRVRTFADSLDVGQEK